MGQTQDSPRWLARARGSRGMANLILRRMHHSGPISVSLDLSHTGVGDAGLACLGGPLKARTSRFVWHSRHRYGPVLAGRFEQLLVSLSARDRSHRPWRRTTLGQVSCNSSFLSPEGQKAWIIVDGALVVVASLKSSQSNLRCPAMRLPRPRFTIRRLMLTVARRRHL